MTLVRFFGATVICTALAGCLPGQTAPMRAPLTVQPGEALLRVDIPSRGVSAMLKQVGRNGEVETWMSADQVSISLSRGVLVATRGLGFDLMAANVEGTFAALKGADPGIYSRRMRYLTGDHHSTYIAAGCRAAFRDGRLEERCQIRGGQFTNLYWTDNAGTILRSQQWVSPELGILEISKMRQ